MIPRPRRWHSACSTTAWSPNDEEIRILQGRAMGRLPEIRVRIGFAGGRPVGCLLGGNVVLMAAPSH
ncbi:hypothetical protein HAP47_0009945 [Bradyrhizobium sp. 41S5]|uniref:hypothetical protein n=1 Tax=Bradyrhizobium sp. 41S5 TaxID=1404443 RepID=UPI001E34CFA6|nr:hypothetical protein [Bradyrhizobium sp. 41S5]UFX46956.1 hypothetical protein HAP47_0009945 [Bradyrhizobium sp. 41S5]